MAANISGPFGFRQYRGNGSAPTYEQILVQLDYNATAIFFGDPITIAADGTVALSVSTGATPSATGISGIFVGCNYMSVAQKHRVVSNYWPGSDVASGQFVNAYIVNDPNAVFIAQTDATGLALADVNATIGFVAGSGNTANGISTAYLDSTTLNTATYNVDAPFRVVGLLQDPPGATGTLANSQAYNYALVAFNNVTTRNFTGA